MMMTAAACGSTRASTRPRCATRCRPPSSRTWSRSIPTTSTSSARCSPATPSTCSSPARTKAPTITEKTEVLFASLTVGGETKKYYRFQTPDDSRRRLLRRDRQEREEVPGAQARQQRDHALGLRRPPPSDPRLYQDAHRRRLGHPYGTPIFASGNGVVEKGRLGRRLRQICPPEAQQRLRDRLRPHVGLRQGHGARQARAPGPGDRLRRIDRACRPAPTSTTKSWSTAASSIRCASSCRAAARSKAR
jgi:hypothetical protein